MNHESRNANEFDFLLKKYPSETGAHENFIKHSPNTRNGIYLFFDFIDLLTNARSNLCNSRRLIFSAFKYNEFEDPVRLERVEITWKLLHNVIDSDRNISANLEKGYILIHKGLHLGHNKQNVSLSNNFSCH